MILNAFDAYNRQNYKLAIEKFDKVIELEANNPDAYLGRGGAYEKTEQFDRAESDFNNAIQLCTNYILLSNAYLGDFYT
jgi:Flp pilus assembly protein TadD